MVKILKIVGVVAFAIALFFVVVGLALYHLIQTGELRRFLISEVEKRTQLKVKIGEAELQMGGVVGVSFEHFGLFEPVSNRPVVTTDKLLIQLALLPLLERRMVFSEIRLFRPALQLDRDGQGKIPDLDFLRNLLFQQGKELPFSFDLHEVKIEKGRIIFRDSYEREEGPAVIQFREMDLNLRQVIAKAPLGYELSSRLDDATQREKRPALEFALKTTIEREGRQVGLTSTGTMLLPHGEFDLRRAWVDASAHVEGLPASLLWDYYGSLLPVKGLNGLLAARVRWQGSLAERLRFQGGIDFKRLEVNAPHLFVREVAPGDGSLTLEVEWTPQEVRLPRLDFKSSEISLSVKASVRSPGEKDPYLEMHLTTPFFPALAVRKYMSLKALQSPPWDYLMGSVSQGELKLKEVKVAGRLSEIRRLFEPGFEKHISLDAEVRGVGGNLPSGRYLPVRDVSGRLVLEDGVLYYKGLKGSYGRSPLVEVEGSQKGVLAGERLLELHVRGEADLDELREQLKLPLMPAPVVRAGGLLQDLGGKGKFRLLLRTDFASSYHYEGQLSLDNARLRVGEFALTQMGGGLSFSPRELRAEEITALLAGSPVRLQLALRDYLSDKGSFDLMVDSSGVRAGAVARVFLSSGSLQDPGMVRGAIRYQGSLGSADDRRLSGALELVGAQPPLALFGEPPRDVVGRVRFDGGGIDFQGIKGRLSGFDFDFEGQWRYAEKPQLTFTFNSPEMDLSHLLSRMAAGSSDWHDRLVAKGKVDIRRGKYSGFEFSDLTTDLTLEKGVWHLQNFSARSLGGTVQGSGSFADDPDGLRFSIEPQVQGVPVQGFLSWLDIGTRQLTGSVNLAGKLVSRGATAADRKRHLTGNFQLEIKDGTMRRLRLLVRILNLMDLTRWFSFELPDFNQTGIRFRSVTGDFGVKGGVYSTENFLVESDDISITGAGQYDAPKDVIDAVVALRPFPRISSIINYIPLIGPGIAGIKDSIVVASFRLQGPVEDATITPAPLSTLSEFFFSALKIPQKLITVPGVESK